MTDAGDTPASNGAPVHVERALLEDAARTLQTGDFHVRFESLGGLEAPWLLAENRYFIVGVAAGRSLEDLRSLENYAASELSERSSREDIGAKRWDAHLVLLAGQDGDVGSADAAAMRNDLRSLRRIVATGVTARPSRLRAALASFLPLPESSVAATRSALDELQAALVVNGVSEADAAEAVAAFTDSGSLDAL